jgi:four helix bundle protein
LLPLLPREEVYGVRSQITRAAVSVASNIAEGWSRETDRDRAHFLAIAQGSLAETETLITVCERLGWMTEEQTATVRGLIVEVSKMLNTLRKQHRAKTNSTKD